MSTTPHAPFSAFRSRLEDLVLAERPEHLERRTWSRDRLIAHQRAALADLVAHAVEHSAFHARRLAGIDLTTLDPTDLRDLPVMTKTDLMEHFDDVLTVPGIDRARVEAALAATNGTPVPLTGDHLAFTSGGSSGVRGTFVYDLPALAQFVGAFSRNLLARLLSFGDLPPDGVAVAYVGAGSAVHMTGVTEPLSEGGRLGLRYTVVPATAPIADIVARLNALAPPLLAGYPSILARLADERAAGRLEITPLAVTATSEPLGPDARTRISAGFGVPLVNGYATTEGLQGMSAPDDEAIVLAEDGCIVELVDADGTPVEPGTPSARVLVTTLRNRAQPLIRYELTDRLLALPAAPDHGHLRVAVHGRDDEHLRWGDVEIHPLTFRSVLVTEPGVVEYQVHQHPDGVVVDVVAPSGDIDGDALADRLSAALAGAGAPARTAEIRPVEAIARHPVTGKVRRFVPLAA